MLYYNIPIKYADDAEHTTCIPSSEREAHQVVECIKDINELGCLAVSVNNILLLFSFISVWKVPHRSQTFGLIMICDVDFQSVVSGAITFPDLSFSVS